MADQIYDKIVIRNDIEANWVSANPVLLEGEVGITMDTTPKKFKVGNVVKSVIRKVTIDKSKAMYVELSRTSPKFLDSLLELEVPEIKDGLIKIVGSARIPGERAKVSLMSLHPNIDAVGATVGTKGVRINAVSKELSNENIDCIEYSNTPEIFIARALSPAIITNVKIANNNFRYHLHLRKYLPQSGTSFCGECYPNATFVVFVLPAFDEAAFQQTGDGPAHRHLVHCGAFGDLVGGQAGVAAKHRDHPPFGDADAEALGIQIGDGLADPVRQQRQAIGQETLQFERCHAAAILTGEGLAGRLACRCHTAPQLENGFI